MNLEAQCCSLKLAIKLKDLGVKQDSLIWHFETPYMYHPQADGTTITEYKWVVGNPFTFDSDMKNCYSAFTASELLGILPKFIGEYFIVVLSDLRQYWSVKYVDSEYTPMGVYPYVYCTHKNLCNALAKMIIFLIENKIIEVPK